MYSTGTMYVHTDVEGVPFLLNPGLKQYNTHVSKHHLSSIGSTTVNGSYYDNNIMVFILGSNKI